MSPGKYRRPGYLTKLCYGLFVYGGLGLTGAVMAAFNMFSRDPKDDLDPWLKAVLVAAPLLVIVCAAYMLKGANWARILFYVACAPVVLSMRIAAEVSGSRDAASAVAPIVASVVIIAVYCVALGMERANRFFTDRETFFRQGERRPKSGSRGGKLPARRDFDY